MKPRSVMVDPDSTSEEKVYATGEIEQRRGGQAWSIPAPTTKAADTSYNPPLGVSVVTILGGKTRLRHKSGESALSINRSVY